jgi:hypothetical protein
MTQPQRTRWVACRMCQGPARAGYARCYQCALQLSEAGRLLADSVVAVRYAVKGGQLASDLWRYKHGGPDAPPATMRLREMLRDFLRDHGPCLLPASAVAIVPSGQGRPGAHPLAGIVTSCLDVPMVALSASPGAAARGREVSLGGLRLPGGAADAVRGASVLVADDTWVSGGSAQSAAVALKKAGAARVTVLVLGRHVDPADPCSAAFAAALGVRDCGVPAHACAAYPGLHCQREPVTALHDGLHDAR